MKLLVAAVIALWMLVGCAGTLAWDDPYNQKQTGPQPPSDPLGR